jgi:hypothetical protein
MPADDRERNFERALARHLRGASPDSSCPDAEILAAYHERTLSLDEMAHWKEHVVGCTRCQESLALVEQTEHLSAEEWEQDRALSPREQTAVAFTRGPASSMQRGAAPALQASIPGTSGTPIDKSRAHLPWRWVAPLGLAAAAAIVWVGVQEARNQRLQQIQQRTAQIAENRETATVPPVSPASPSAVERLKKVEPEAKSASPRKAPVAVAPVVVPPKATASASGASPNAPNRTPNREFSNGLTAPSNAEAEVRPAPPVAGYVEKEEAADQIAPASAPNARARADADTAKKQAENAPPPAAAETVQVQAPTTNKAAATQVASYRNGFAAELLLLAKADSHYIVAPGLMQAWRLGNGGLIEHSTDAGKNWKPQTSGVTTDLTSGSAPSEKVCWVIGKAGTILLTTDGGKHWKALTSPIVADLGGIHATDALHASVWDVSNRISFETADGGVTWTRSANE